MAFNVLSLFSGAGGLSVGFSKYFNIVLAVDCDKYAVQTYQKNFQNVKVLPLKVEDVNWSEELNNLQADLHNIDIVIGGPPCQGFSTGNTHTREANHPLNNLWMSYMKVVEILQPKWFVMENVPGIRNINGNKNTVDEIIRVFKDEINYHVEEKTLLASEYGVPQNRRRVLFVGSRDGYKFIFPEPTTTKEDFITVGDAIIGDLPPLEDKDGNLIEGTVKLVDYISEPKNDFQKIMRNGSTGITSHITVKSSEEVRNRWRDIPPGGNWSDITPKNTENWRNVSAEELKKVSHSNLYKRLDPGKPSITIANFRRSMICHPKENRIISIREAARLQSFPDNYIFVGPKSKQQQMVANAVPPLLSTAIAHQLYKIMNGNIDLEKTIF